MIRNTVLASLVFASVLAFGSGCGGAQEVEVSGEAKSASAGAITLQFFEVPEEGEEAATTPIKTTTLAKPGAFKETLEVEGTKIRVLALADADKNNACTEGEEWAEISADVTDDGKVAPITLELTKKACPAAASAKE